MFVFVMMMEHVFVYTEPKPIATGIGCVTLVSSSGKSGQQLGNTFERHCTDGDVDAHEIIHMHHRMYCPRLEGPRANGAKHLCALHSPSPSPSKACIDVLLEQVDKVGCFNHPN